MALAQAILEYISFNVHAKTLFSTHYHELTKMSETLPNIKNIHVKVHEEDDNITFLYKIDEGCANKSYGINVARLANLPVELINRASELLNNLEVNKAVDSKVEYIVKEETPKWLDELKNIDPVNMSPMECMQYLYELKRKLKEHE